MKQKLEKLLVLSFSIETQHKILNVEKRKRKNLHVCMSQHEKMKMGNGELQMAASEKIKQCRAGRMCFMLRVYTS